jgi:MFS family permease
MVDVTPLRASRSFRWLFLSQCLTTVGAMVTQIAIPLQVYGQTRSSLAVGLVGLAAVVPVVVFGLFGGAIADAMDRRRLVVVTSTGSATVSVVLVVQALLALDQLWLLYLCVAVQSAFAVIDMPARRSLVPRLVETQHIAAATALLYLLFNLGIVGGPMIAGVIVAAGGFAAAYGLEVATFAVAILAICRLPSVPPGGGGRQAGWSSVVEGLAFVRSRPVLWSSLLLDLDATVLAMPTALFPMLAVERFHGGPATAASQYSALAAGALVASLCGGWLPAVRRQGRLMLIAIVGWGSALIMFGLAQQLWFALAALALAGAADAIGGVARSTILQQDTPDHMRGRTSGALSVVGASGPQLGSLRAGAVAAAFGPEVAAVVGGLTCVVGAVAVKYAVPALDRYEPEPRPQPGETPTPA